MKEILYFNNRIRLITLALSQRTRNKTKNTNYMKFCQPNTFWTNNKIMFYSVDYSSILFNHTKLYYPQYLTQLIEGLCECSQYDNSNDNDDIKLMPNTPPEARMSHQSFNQFLVIAHVLYSSNIQSIHYAAKVWNLLTKLDNFESFSCLKQKIFH